MNDEEIAKSLHDYYELVSKSNGWQTQKETQVKFENLPEANKRVMINMGKYVNHLIKLTLENERKVIEKEQSITENRIRLLERQKVAEEIFAILKRALKDGVSKYSYFLDKEDFEYIKQKFLNHSPQIKKLPPMHAGTGKNLYKTADTNNQEVGK